MFSSDTRNAKSLPYFRSNCIRVCRLESIIALCNCIPFFYRDLVHTFINSTKICTMDKVPCLSHYNGIHLLHELINKLTPSNVIACLPFFFSIFVDMIFMGGPRASVFVFLCVRVWVMFAVKWLTPLFSREKDVGVETEFENGLSCLHCLPSCSLAQFSISTTRLPLRTLPAQARNTVRL